MKVLWGPVVAAVLLSLLVIGCASGPPSPMTLEEYTEVVCGSQVELGESEASTWGEAEKGFAGLFEDMEGAAPPEALIDYHATQLALVKYFLDYSGEQDGDSEMNPYEAVASPEFRALTTAFAEAWHALEDDTKAILESKGCDAA